MHEIFFVILQPEKCGADERYMSIYNKKLYIEMLAHFLWSKIIEEKEVMASFTNRQWEKVKAVLLYILQQFPQGADYIHLFKIMYFAQQQHLKVYGLPLIDDSFAAHKHGPVPSHTYEALRAVERKEGRKSAFKWATSVFDVRMDDKHPIVSVKKGQSYDPDELSESNIEILDAVIAQYKDMSSYELSRISHKDKAYKDAWKRYQDTGEDDLITMVAIARSAGATPEMQEIIRERLLVRDALR